MDRRLYALHHIFHSNVRSSEFPRIECYPYSNSVDRFEANLKDRGDFLFLSLQLIGNKQRVFPDRLPGLIFVLGKYVHRINSTDVPHQDDSLVLIIRCKLARIVDNACQNRREFFLVYLFVPCQLDNLERIELVILFQFQGNLSQSIEVNLCTIGHLQIGIECSRFEQRGPGSLPVSFSRKLHQGHGRRHLTTRAIFHPEIVARNFLGKRHLKSRPNFRGCFCNTGQDRKVLDNFFFYPFYRLCNVQMAFFYGPLAKRRILLLDKLNKFFQTYV